MVMPELGERELTRAVTAGAWIEQAGLAAMPTATKKEAEQQAA
jgi:hypothetical protein